MGFLCPLTSDFLHILVAREKLRPDWPMIEIEGAGHITCLMKDQFKQELLKRLDHQR